MNSLRLVDGKVVVTMFQLEQALLKWPKAAGVSDACCCAGEPPPCEPCGDFVQEITVTLTVYDGTAPFGGVCGGVSGEYEMVLSLNVNGPGWYGFVDMDADGVFTPGIDYEVRVTIEDCAMSINTNIGNSLGSPASWPNGSPGAGYGFGTCATPPDGNLPTASSPYCAPPPGTYEYFYYLLEPLPGTPECDAKFCAWKLVIQ